MCYSCTHLQHNQTSITCKLGYDISSFIRHLIERRMDENLISNSEWSELAQELVQLQQQYPDIAKDCVYHEEFIDFDGSSGYDLPLRDPWAVNKATQLVRWSKNK